ncbi:LuxR C-terminal-related transcriptional regulator [Actinocatenispora thailandica]|uniref:LuxR C-terminal-related transcriptional regulator n=1 Tax=Actinocatenispora thailandica TaxID=227318 RepID=UPI00194F8917|nr:LuxR C-terminal-related transcriptional regulator [Actinocatenispora thailandica]
MAYHRPAGAVLRHPELPVGLPPTVAARVCVPRGPSVRIARPRPERRLTELAVAGTVLVTAGPGEGKTVLVAGWAGSGQAPGRLAWYTLPEADADPVTFWSGVLAAVGRTGVRLGDGRPRLLAPPDGRPDRQVDEILALLYDLSEPLVLVLDGVHTVRDRSVLERLDLLLMQPPPALRLVLLGRTDPRLRLHRLRLDGLLGEIRTPELRFDRTETVRFLRAHGLSFDDAQTARLLVRTGGWAAGLRFAAMSADRADPARGLARFSGATAPVADYLADEVVAPLPPAIRSFLLRTSVVDRVSGSLATALSGRLDSQRLLEGLSADIGLIQTADERGEWFAYHALLREYLYHRLLLEEPDAASATHRRAARWYGEHLAPLPALRHAVSSGDDEEIGRILFTLALPRLMSDEGARLVDEVRPLAANARTAPSLATLTCAAVTDMHRRDFTRAGTRLRQARSLLPDKSGALRHAADVGLSALEAITAGSLGELAAARSAAIRVLAMTGSDSASELPALAEYRALARWRIGRTQLWQGAVSAAYRTLREAAVVAGACRLDLAVLSADAHRAVAEVARGELRTGTRLARSTLASAERDTSGREPYLAAAFLALALAELQQDHPLVAARYLARAGAAADAGADQLMGRAVRVAEARLRVQSGDQSVARRVLVELRDGALPGLLAGWLQGAEIEAELAAGAPEQVIERLDAHRDPGDWDRIWLGWAELALHRPDSARRRIAPLRRSADRGRAVAVEESLITALAAEALRQDGAAVEAVDRALGLACEDRLSHPFRIAGDRLAPLVRRQQRVLGTYAAFADTLFDERIGTTSEPPAEPLTERELTVLRYLPSMSSNDEIAADLHLSVNTVKTHLKSLFRKLAVNNRREAIRQGRVRGLLDPPAATPVPRPGVNDPD